MRLVSRLCGDVLSALGFLATGHVLECVGETLDLSKSHALKRVRCVFEEKKRTRPLSLGAALLDCDTPQVYQGPGLSDY